MLTGIMLTMFIVLVSHFSMRTFADADGNKCYWSLTKVLEKYCPDDGVRL